MSTLLGYLGYFTASVTVVAWVGAAMVLLMTRGGIPGPRVRRMKAFGSELSPFIPPLAVVTYLCGELAGFPRDDLLILAGTFLLAWVLFRWVFDDRWRRRGRRLAERLGRAGSRLAGAAAGG